MANHTSKKLFAGICALSAAFILASCDPITSTPVNYNDPIVLDENGNTVEDDSNKLGKIYDAIASDRNSKIVSQILEEVATNRFGTYTDIMTAGDSATSEEEKMDYIGKHTDVFVDSKDEKTELHGGKSAKEVQLNRLDIFYKDIKARISEAFWNEVTSGSYNDEEGRFDEGKLWMAHYYEFYDLGNRDAALGNAFFITNEHNKDNIMDYLKGEYSNGGDETKRGYIEEKLFPQILKDKLVEEYVYKNDTTYSSLGRAYARKVNYVKVSYEGSPRSTQELMWKFAEDHIVNDDAAPDFEIITKALKGFEGVGKFTKDSETDGKAIIPLATDSDSYELLAAVYPGVGVATDKDNDVGVTVPEGGFKFNEDLTLIPAGRYFKNTKLGEIIVSYKKAIKAEEAGRFPLANDKAELDKFTASGKSKEYGLREKLISLAKEDYTTDGWFIKNGGLSELPSALRDRLFNINVANKLDNGETVYEAPAALSPSGEDTMGAYENGTSKRVPYMRNINGHKYVIPAKSLSYEKDNYNYVYHDTGAKAFYIVEVLEAPSTPKLKLDKDNSASYINQAETKAETAGFEYKTEEVARAVAKVLGTKDSYIKDAYTDILDKYTFEFYETSLYEHFKSEYPDLFDDED